MNLFERILESRGLTLDSGFLNPIYDDFKHDPFLMPDMEKAIERLKVAHKKQEKITIYGDYDIDGLTATTLLYDAMKSFGFENVETFIPNRFTEGFGLNLDAVERIIKNGTSLIVTVDCGSTSLAEIEKINQLGGDIVVTDHHGALEKQPPAVAVVNPKRSDNKYPFVDLAGVGVAFKLVQAMQTEFNGLPDGQEKWLLDLVAFGTVCDAVKLLDENRANVFWGLKVLAQTRRKGLLALMEAAGVKSDSITTQSLGFALGPRMNAAGRLDTAQYALDMLLADDLSSASEKAQLLDDLNIERKTEQNKIFYEAVAQAENFIEEPVLVLSAKGWNHGIVGIVASKILEKYGKPTFVMQEMGDETKGSARSYGDFDVSAAIRSSGDIVTKGGGHKLAAGVTLPTKNIDKFRMAVNEYYKKQGLKLDEQRKLLLPKADADAELGELTEELIEQLKSLEPFGNGNDKPVIKSDNLLVVGSRTMGDKGQHIKLQLKDESGATVSFIAFGAPDSFFVNVGEYVSVWYQPEVNEWRGNVSVEGRMLYIK